MAQRVVDHTISPEELEASEKEVKKAKKIDESTDSEGSTSTSGRPGKRKKTRSTKYKQARKKVIESDAQNLEDAVKLLKKIKFAGFVEAVEMHINLGIDPRNSDQRIRFTTSLPHGTGKSVKILVISDKDDGEKGDVIWRNESVVQEIADGKIQPGTDFHVVVATPDKMKTLASVARILGPKGLMPSPKTNTVTDKPEDVMKNLAGGQVEVKTQPGHTVVHQFIGKIDFDTKNLVENAQHVIDQIKENRPAKIKGKFIKSAYLASTMGPSVRIEV
jgi:large subunit ribosomal protein L1